MAEQFREEVIIDYLLILLYYFIGVVVDLGSLIYFIYNYSYIIIRSFGMTFVQFKTTR